MEKNKQIIEFGDIIQDIDDRLVLHYDALKSMFLDFIEYNGMSWTSYCKGKTRNDILADFIDFNCDYLPF